jgi:proteasome lid subunit RPN8/RPN11
MEHFGAMWRALVSILQRFGEEVGRTFRQPVPRSVEPAAPLPPKPMRLQPLERVVLTDGVGRTLFEEFASHVAGPSGEDETGWMLLGIREETSALVVATLPAGANSDAGVGHVRFDSWSQAIGSRILRQSDRRLGIVGIVHTHPGSLRHPSEGDYRGDRIWVGQLRGKEGIFAIGTSDNHDSRGNAVANQPRPNVQCMGKFRFSWYALAEGDRSYRPLEVTFTLGPDMARRLHEVWPAIEAHAERLDRLCRQQANVTFELNEAKPELGLVVNIPLAEPGNAIRIALGKDEVRYFVLRNNEHFSADPGEVRVDRAVYILLTELAARAD